MTTATAAPLTARQREVLEYVRDYRNVQGYCASVSDVCSHFGFKSKNGAMCHLLVLRKKGLITWIDNQPRTLRVTEAGA